jgi:hypothetical protein
MSENANQELMDAFYFKNGPCCAGCDWWQSGSPVSGECRRSAPVSARERVELLGMTNLSLKIGAGHVLTPRDHHCGDFKDEFDWSTLTPWYRRRVGAPASPVLQSPSPRIEEGQSDV